MTDDTPQHRVYHQPDPGSVSLREEDDEDGVFRVRMPIVSTGEVRNEGDDPLEREEVAGMAEQVNDGGVGAFLDHGSAWDISDARYGATEKLGYWEDAELTENDAGETIVEADAVLMDPETLPDETGALREALASLKEQVKRDIPLSSSIGWRDDDAYPGGVDLMETSIVGIPADPRTTSQNAPAALAARALAAPDADEFERRLDDLRAVVMGSDDTSEHDMTDDDTEPGDEAGDETRDEQDSIGAEEFREQMLEMQRQQTETLSTLSDAIREDDEDEEEDGEENESDDEEDEEDEQSADEPSDTQDADTDDEEESRTVEIDGEEVDAADEIRRLRGALDEAGVESPGPDDEQDADVDDDAGDETTTSDRSVDGPDWRA